MGKLSTWLVVTLTAAAFAVGLATDALLNGGGSPRHAATAPSAAASTGRAAPAQQPAPTPTTPAKPAPPRPAPAKPKPVTVETGPAAPPVSGPKTVTVGVPESNPVASSSPAPTVTVAAPAAPGAPAPAPAAPVPPGTGATGEPSEPVELQPSVRQSMAAEEASLLNANAPAEAPSTGGKGVQELEHCLQLIADSSLPPGVEPSGCNLGG